MYIATRGGGGGGTHWLVTRNPNPPHLGSYTKSLLVSQERRHLFVIPSWEKVFYIGDPEVLCLG
jgi:hypothetical protein